LQELIEQTIACFNDEPSAREYIHNIKKRFPRYVRDHLQVLLKSLSEPVVNVTESDKALTFCINNSLFSGYDFTQVLDLFQDKKPVIAKSEIKLLDKKNLEKATQAPEKSNIEEYENIINQ
jgi:hypothetical protein